jgi:hypothetical protein
VRQKTHAPIAQAKYLRHTTSAIVVEQAHYFAFADLAGLAR